MSARVRRPAAGRKVGCVPAPNGTARKAVRPPAAEIGPEMYPDMVLREMFEPGRSALVFPVLLGAVQERLNDVMGQDPSDVPSAELGLAAAHIIDALEALAKAHGDMVVGRERARANQRLRAEGGAA